MTEDKKVKCISCGQFLKKHAKTPAYDGSGEHANIIFWSTSYYCYKCSTWRVLSEKVLIEAN